MIPIEIARRNGLVRSAALGDRAVRRSQICYLYANRQIGDAIVTRPAPDTEHCQISFNAPDGWGLRTFNRTVALFQIIRPGELKRRTVAIVAGKMQG